MIQYSDVFGTMNIYCDDEDCMSESVFDGSRQECIELAKMDNWIIKPIADKMFGHFCSHKCAKLNS